MRRLILCCSLSAVFLISTLLLAAPIRAASTITVTTLIDLIDHTDGVCSLREAIIAANTDTGAADCAAGSGADTIVFDAGLSYPGSIVLAIAGANENAALSGDLDLSGSLIISGPGSSLLAVDGNQLDRVFEILGGARVSISGLQIKNGDAGTGSGGGFAINTSGVLTLTNNRVISNVATYGGGVWVAGRLNGIQSEIALNHNGGIFNAGGAVILSTAQILSNTQGYGIWNEGALVFNGGALNDNAGGGLHNSGSPVPSANLSDVSVIGNTGGSGIYNVSGSTTVLRSQILSNTGVSGGGVYNGDVFASPSINIQDSMIGYNVASVNGGGIFNYNFLTLRTSTLFHNRAASGGGLHYNAASGLTLMNVTFTGNAASNNGGAIYNKAGVTLVNATIADNTADGQGGAIFDDGAQSWSKNTIIFNNVGSNGACEGDAGAHISLGYNLGDDASCNLTATGDITNSNPLLEPLHDNGGFTWTRALQLGSPAIDHATNSGCPATDQRGLTRPQNGVCDIGAYEAGNLPPSYTLTTSTAGSGSGVVTRSPNQPTYFAGTIVTLTTTPNIGSKFSGWSGAIGGLTNPLSLTMDTDKSVTATFDLLTYTLAVNTVGGGAVVRQPDQLSYPHGSQVVLTATANSDYAFAGWSGSATGAENPLAVIMNTNKIITATFVPVSYALTIDVSGHGSVSKNPDLPSYRPGALVTLTATPDAGSSFINWSGSISGTTNPITLTMDTDHNVIATFSDVTYTLSVNAVGPGSVTRDPDLLVYASGTVVTLTATPQVGSGFIGWSGSISGTTNPIAITMNAHRVMTATFISGQLPIANTGQPQTVKSQSPVILDGSSSHDPDNHVPLIYGWRQVGGEVVLLSSATISRPAFTAPAAVTQSQTLTFALVVTNTLGITSTPAEVTITVEPYRCLLPVVLR